MIRFNTTLGSPELYDGTRWVLIDPPRAYGGDEVQFDDTTGTYTHFFYNTGTNAIRIANRGNYEVFVIGGGGSGGNSGNENNEYASGGAGGGLAYINRQLTAAFYEIVIGPGANFNTGYNTDGNIGQSSSFTGNGIDLQATGGNGGVSLGTTTTAGGTGSGGDINGTGGTGGGGRSSGTAETGGDGANGAPGGGGGGNGNGIGGDGGNGDADFFTGGGGAGVSDRNGGPANSPGTGYFDGGTSGTRTDTGTNGEGPVGGSVGNAGSSRPDNGGGGGSFGGGGGGSAEGQNLAGGGNTGGEGAGGAVIVRYTI